MTGTVNPEAIPLELRQANQWTVRRAKVPYRSDGRGKAKSNDPSTWSTFAQALEGVQRGRGDGLYYALQEASGIVGIDLDHCVENGVIQPWARAYVNLLNSWTCLSASGTGLRIFVKGTKPSTECKRGHTEYYDHDRVLSITDQLVPGTPATIEERQAELEAFHKLAFPPRAKPEAQRTAATTVAAHLPSDALFTAAQRDQKFTRLHAGDTAGYSSASEARFAYLLKAAFYAQRDAALMDRWFRSSGLDQRKWDRLSARELDKAIDLTPTTYTAAPRPRVDGSGDRCDPLSAVAVVDLVEPIGSDGAVGCQGCQQREQIILERNAELAELRAGQSKLAEVLRIPSKQLAPTQKLVAIVSTFELMSAESRAPGTDHRLYTATVAEKTGLSKATAGDALKTLSAPGGIFERSEGWERISPTTGEVFEPPRRVCHYRPRYEGTKATFAALVEYEPARAEGKLAHGGDRPKRPKDELCSQHPEAGSVVRCAEPTCNRPLAVAVPADPERWRPSGQDDFMGAGPLETAVDTSMGGHLDHMGPVDHERPERGHLVLLRPPGTCTDCRGPLPPGRIYTCDACIDLLSEEVQR
jgi:hypothetical protein